MAPPRSRKTTKRKGNAKSRGLVPHGIWPSGTRAFAAEEAVEPFRLLSLPGEIRRLIYRHYLVKDIPIKIPKRQAVSDFENLQLVCKQMKSEVRPVFYRENCFYWCDELVGRQWDFFRKGPITRIHSLMVKVRSLDVIWQHFHTHSFLVWIASSDYRLLQGGPGRLRLKQLTFHIPSHHSGRCPQEQPPPEYEDLAATDILAPQSYGKPSQCGNLPRMKGVRSIRLDTTRPVHPLWINKIRRESGCDVEVGKYS